MERGFRLPPRTSLEEGLRRFVEWFRRYQADALSQARERLLTRGSNSSVASPASSTAGCARRSAREARREAPSSLPRARDDASGCRSARDRRRAAARLRRRGRDRPRRGSGPRVGRQSKMSRCVLTRCGSPAAPGRRSKGRPARPRARLAHTSSAMRFHGGTRTGRNCAGNSAVSRSKPGRSSSSIVGSGRWSPSSIFFSPSGRGSRAASRAGAPNVAARSQAGRQAPASPASGRRRGRAAGRDCRASASSRSSAGVASTASSSRHQKRCVGDCACRCVEKRDETRSLRVAVASSRRSCGLRAARAMRRASRRRNRCPARRRIFPARSSRRPRRAGGAAPSSSISRRSASASACGSRSRHEPAGLAVRHQLRNAGDIGREHRHAQRPAPPSARSAARRGRRSGRGARGARRGRRASAVRR